MSPLVVVEISGATSGGCAHGVLVVLTDEDDGKLPQHGHVEGLVELTLVGRTVAVEGECDSAGVKILLCERNACAEGCLGAHNAVASPELARDVEHVH